MKTSKSLGRLATALLETLETRMLMSGPGGAAGGGGPPVPTPPPIVVPLVPPPATGGPGGGGGVLNGGGGGGGPVARAGNPFIGHTWFGLIGNSSVAITFNVNSSFTLVDTTPTGQVVTIQGSYTITASPVAGLGGVAQTQVTLTSWGNVVLSGVASFVSPDVAIFTMGSESLQGAGTVSTGVQSVLAAGV